MMSSDYDRWTDLVDREASGEPLTDDERQFVREFSRTDPRAQAEARVFEELASLAPLADDVENRKLAENAVLRAVERRYTSARSARLRVFLGFGTLAAAASAAFFARGHLSSPAVESAAASRLEYVRGDVRVDGVPASVGAPVALGSRVEVSNGVACVAVEPTIHVCLAPGAKAVVASAGTAQRRVDLLEGRAAAALQPLPRGERFSVVSHGVWSTAVGTAFSVEFVASTVKTVVHEGKVRVGGEEDGVVVPAHKIGLSEGGKVEIETVKDHVATETEDWKALGAVAHRSIEGPLVAEEAPLSAPVAAVQEPEAPRSAGPSAARERHVEESGKTMAPSDLLSEARRALREQRWQAAAEAYRELVRKFPGSAEARTALVPLAGLEIDRLGQPAVALGHLDSYLAGGGALAMEARLSRIRAYRALGRAGDEARAIDEFLAEHPSSLEAARLRERRAALGAP